jgi:subtilisin-like proprotein convertase family protein
LPILDFRTTTSTLTISDSFTIADLDVKLNMAHTYDGDLTVTLRGPSGATVTLFRNVGGSGDNFTNTVLDDEAAGSITSGNAPFSGSLKPQTALSAFDGKNARGTWTLSVTDSYRYDTGTLKGWSLIVGAPSASVKGLMDEELGDAVAAFTAPTQATRPVSRPDMGLLVRLYAGCLGSGGSSGSEPCNATPRRAATLEAAVGTIEVRSDLVPQPSSMPDVQRMFRAVSGHRASPSDPQGVANADGMDSGPAIVPAGMEGAPAMSELEGVRIVQRIK